MLDFRPVREKRLTYAELAAGLTKADLHRLTDEMIDTMLEIIAGCVDADVTFAPSDPAADDPYAATAAEATIAWTLGHVIVHTTASAEESAALAAELARGVEFHGRSRYEVPWQTVTAADQLYARLEESRRMRHASLETWPDKPHLDNTYQSWSGGPILNCVARFVAGLKHDDDHLGQLADIVRQAQAARGASTLTASSVQAALPA
jgi:hypothetical protein